MSHACGAMAMNVCGMCGSDGAYIATKWRSVMNLDLVTKFTKNDSLR